MSCRGDRSTRLRPGLHSAVRCPAIDPPHRLAGHGLGCLHPVPVPFERGAQEPERTQIQTGQENALCHVPPQEGFDPSGLQAGKLPIAPFLHTGTLTHRTGMDTESAELLAESPRKVAMRSVRCGNRCHGIRRVRARHPEMLDTILSHANPPSRGYRRGFFGAHWAVVHRTRNIATGPDPTPRTTDGTGCIAVDGSGFRLWTPDLRPPLACQVRGRCCAPFEVLSPSTTPWCSSSWMNRPKTSGKYLQWTNWILRAVSSRQGSCHPRAIFQKKWPTHQK